MWLVETGDESGGKMVSVELYRMAFGMRNEIGVSEDSMQYWMLSSTA
jgi:hypothetical protein